MTQKHTTTIGLVTATIVGMNAMIGSGIFTAPAAMASHVGPAGIIAYLFVVCAVLCMGLSLARLATLFPHEGSFYAYTKVWAGHIGGLIAAFLYLAGPLTAMGLLVHTATFYLQPFFPMLSSYTLGAGTIIFLTLLNMFGITLSELGQHILIACTLFPLLATTVLCFIHGNIAHLTPFAPYGFANVFKATRIVIFGFFGFECATSLFSIVENPSKNVPRALTYSILCVGLIYTLFIASIIFCIPSHYLANPLVPLSTTLRLILPDYSWLITCIHFSILSAVIGTIHSMIWGTSTLMVSLRNIIDQHARSRTSLCAQTIQKITVLIVGVCILISFSTITNLDLFFNITALCIISAMILSMITLLTLKSEWVSGHNGITILGIGTALTILYYAVEGTVHEIAKII